MDDLKYIIKLLNEQGKKLSKLENLLTIQQKKNPNHPVFMSPSDTSTKKIPDKIIKLIVENLNELKIPMLVLLALKFHGPLTRSKQKMILEKWGKRVGENLRSGNYKRDLVSKGLIHEFDSSDSKLMYELTAKGNIEADKIIHKLEVGKIGDE